MLNINTKEQAKDVAEKKLIILITIVTTLIAVMLVWGGVFIQAVSGVHLSATVVDDSVLLWYLDNNTFSNLEVTDTLCVEKYDDGKWTIIQTVKEEYVEEKDVLKGYGYCASEYFNLEYFNTNNYYQKYRLSKTYKIDGVEKTAYYEFEVDEYTEKNQVKSIKSVERDEPPYLLEMFKKDNNKIQGK